jgi:hypothetical protein
MLSSLNLGSLISLITLTGSGFEEVIFSGLEELKVSALIESLKSSKALFLLFLSEQDKRASNEMKKINLGICLFI